MTDNPGARAKLRIKVITSDKPGKIESMVNDFLEGISCELITDIRLTVAPSGSSTDELYTAMIVFKHYQH
ncbi:sporulation protein Cse60 [Alicyclobacillus tolerans]|uniref:sporulation protein Cse60 n=1 Tax=Alicyclobacillus tolerans TaxID=90970 RepID=UPI001F4127E6|nr:sporulation protein Cse60 [Alicyclobacillus tolerans]MCF8566937.1 sporulation protein Cse60 [Alicyclobacillus tolerans]